MDGRQLEWHREQPSSLFFRDGGFLYSKKERGSIMLNQTISELLEQITPLEASQIESLLEVPPQKEWGDLAFPCFTLAKEWRKTPQQIAHDIVDQWAQIGLPLGIQANVEGAYVNFTFDRGLWIGKLLEKGITSHIVPAANDSKTVLIDFSSPNIAKPMSVGHGRATMIGNALAQMHAFLGRHVIRINHLGDWGTQFGKQIAAYKLWGDEDKVKANPIPELLQLYVRFHEEALKKPGLDDLARDWFRRLEDGDSEATALWKWFVDISLRTFDQMYARLGVEFDYHTGESFYNDKMDRVTRELEEKGLLVESDGARVVDLSSLGMPPCIVIKQDGSSIYATRDLAAAIYRQENYHFDEALYVVGAEQTLHFQQVFAVLDQMGYEWSADCKHVPFGLVKFQGKKMSTRKGSVVFLDEILDEAVQRALQIIEERNPTFPGKKEAAEAIGIGAVLFNDLKNTRMHTIDFKWEEALNFDGETGPYLQYTYARTQSLMDKGDMGEQIQDYLSPNKLTSVDVQTIATESGWELALVLKDFISTVKMGVDRSETSVLARYLLEVAKRFNRFYQHERILVENDAEKLAKLLLVQWTSEVLGKGLQLLGMKALRQV
jgi:arginyl-tRNA synthetase